MHLKPDDTILPMKFSFSAPFDRIRGGYCLRRDGANYYDDGERFHELDPVNLTHSRAGEPLLTDKPEVNQIAWR